MTINVYFTFKFNNKGLYINLFFFNYPNIY